MKGFGGFFSKRSGERKLSGQHHQVKSIEITEEQFSGIFELPTEGLSDLSEVPKDLIFDAWSIFSKSGEQVQTSCKKRKMKYEFRLLNDILAKSVTVTAGSFDAVTHERFLLMTAIQCGLKINWNLALCEPKPFPTLKVLNVKTVGTYISKQKSIDDSREENEPVAKKTTVKKAVSKKRPAAPGDETVVKKQRTFVGRAAPAAKDLALVTVAQEVVPLQIVPVVTPPTPTRKAPKRILKLPKGSDDEEPVVEDVVETERETTVVDDVDQIIVQEMMLPSVTAAEPTRIKFGLGIEIPGVNEGDCYKASFPQIVVSDKGKAPLVEKDEIKGHPAREMFSLICADIDFLVQLREKVIADVVSFFHSFCLRRLPVLDSSKDIVAKEKQILEWAETDSLQTVVQRRTYIVAKYREMLLRKFLEAHRKNFRSGQPSTAITLQIIDLLSNSHQISLEKLLKQKRAHGLEWQRPCCAKLFEGNMSAITLQIIDLLSNSHQISLEKLLKQKRAHGLEWQRPCCAKLFEGNM
ncbi:hypothetical protein F511_21917 [Dorcoceras hygrometricum]|uniref:Uncharacterized protein n=1 Tax=Dorcoceras hygrometricum TaxID=472368 RepID=A0A2Z7B0K8_9LAMI|nr:hypothetical protein F511_21917 [Dorcoceras hygrometricum]